MQRAYRVLSREPGEPLSVQEVLQPEGIPIAEVAERMGWLLSAPPGAVVYSPQGELRSTDADGSAQGADDVAPTTHAEPPARRRSGPPRKGGRYGP